MSESALLKHVIEALIGGNEDREATLAPLEQVPASGRLSVRLAADDLLLLRERARSRGMPSATYISLLVRSHLRNLSPIPDNELEVLQQAIGQMSAIGRNLNQSDEHQKSQKVADCVAAMRAKVSIPVTVKMRVGVITAGGKQARCTRSRLTPHRAGKCPTAWPGTPSELWRAASAPEAGPELFRRAIPQRLTVQPAEDERRAVSARSVVSPADTSRLTGRGLSR